MNGQELHYGGFWRRVAASVIDYLVLSLLGLLVVAVGIVLGAHNYLLSTPELDLEIWANLIWALLGLLYFAGMESSAKQATLGKLAAGLVVTDLQEERITFVRAICRYMAKIPSALILLIGFLMVAFTKRKQGLHDKLTSCLVIKRNKSRVFRVFLLVFLLWILGIGGLGYFVYVSVLPQWLETMQEQANPLDLQRDVQRLLDQQRLKCEKLKMENQLTIADGTAWTDVPVDKRACYTACWSASVAASADDGDGWVVGKHSLDGDDAWRQAVLMAAFYADAQMNNKHDPKAYKEAACVDKTGNSDQATIEWLGGTYTGEVSDGVPHGQGTVTFPDGSMYFGEYRKGKHHGQGTLTSSDGSKYVGEWKDDKEWEGIWYLASGEIEATYSEGQRCESCSITYSNGDQYVGDISNGIPHGEGTYIYVNGDKYVGGFKSFSFHGMGTYYFASGNRYDGYWEDDQPYADIHFPGTFIWANGDQYVGGFKDGNRHGQGTLTWADGAVWSGLWREGQAVVLENAITCWDERGLVLDVYPKKAFGSWVAGACAGAQNEDWCYCPGSYGEETCEAPNREYCGQDLCNWLAVQTTEPESGERLEEVMYSMYSNEPSDYRLVLCMPDSTSASSQDLTVPSEKSKTGNSEQVTIDYWGGTYIGEVSDGVPNGQGSFTRSDLKYVGEWYDGLNHGQGTLIMHETGEKYVGEFLHSRFHGEGTLTRSDGSKYVGEWKAHKEWEGIWYLASGEIEATYSEGKR